MKSIKKEFSITLILMFFLAFQITFSYSQINSNQREYYKWFDSIIGDGNIGLYNGIRYQKQYRTLNDQHEFYLSSDYHIGDVVYYNQMYYDVELKYNVYNDELIAKLPNQSGFSFIQLIKEKVESFSIKDSQFVKQILRKDDSDENNEMFLLLLFKGNVTILYKDLNKTKKRHFLDKGFHYNSFKDKNNFYLKYGENYYKIKFKKDFLRLFPKRKKEINDFYKKHESLIKVNIDLFFTEIVKWIDESL